MSVAEVVAGAIKGTADVGLGIYNAWRTQKNQETEWKRQDSAIQRQVKDAEKAGFNKWSVLGGSGASTSTAIQAGTIDPDVSGSAVDALSSMYSLASQRAQAQYQQNQAEISSNNKEMSDNQVMVNNWQTAMSIAGMMRDAGFQFDNFVITDPYQKRRPGIAWTGSPAYPGAEMSKSNDESLFNLEYDANYHGTRAAVEQNKITGDWAQVSNVIKILQGIFGTVRDVGSAYRSFRGSGKKK